MKRHAPSILSRILWLHLLALIATAIVVPLAVNILLNSTATSLQHRTLHTHADTIAQALDVTPDGRWRLNLSQDLRTLYDKSYGGFTFAVVDDRGALLFVSPAHLASIFRAIPRRNTTYFFERKYEAATFYGASFMERRNGHAVWIMVAQNLEHPDMIVDDIVTGFLGQVILLTAPLLLILFSVDLLIIRRALKPLMTASSVARTIQPGNVDQRLPTADLPREILPMAEATNEALARLEAGYAAQREFTADAAHELRTPLAILRMRVDALPEKETAASLRPDIDLMGRIVGQLLEMAELDAVLPGSNGKTDLYALGMDVAVALMPMALAHDKTLELGGIAEPVWVAGSEPLLFRAVRNLVENAIHHTPTGTHIEIRIQADGVIHVIDNGPGIPDDERDHIFQRFWRGERNRNGGAGLGLAIVQRIAETYGGAVTLRTASSGGAHFSLQIPLLANSNA